MTWLVPDARHHRPHRDPALVVQRRHGRRLQPGGERARLLDQLDPHVVVHHHVAACGQDALQPADAGRRRRLLVRLSSRPISTASLRRIGSPKTSRPWSRSVVPVSTTSAMTSATPRVIGGLDGAVQPDHVAAEPCSARCAETSPA